MGLGSTKLTLNKADLWALSQFCEVNHWWYQNTIKLWSTSVLHESGICSRKYYFPYKTTLYIKGYSIFYYKFGIQIPDLWSTSVEYKCSFRGRSETTFANNPDFWPPPPSFTYSLNRPDPLFYYICIPPPPLRFFQYVVCLYVDKWKYFPLTEQKWNSLRSMTTKDHFSDFLNWGLSLSKFNEDLIML